MRYLFIAVAAAALIGSTAALAQQQWAQQPRPSPEIQRLREFIGSSDHLQAVRAAIAAFEPAALAAACKDVRPTKGRAWKPVEDPLFDPGAAAPKNAVWQETWEVSACGKAGVRNLAFVARPGQGVVPLPMFPGESLADVRLQHDAGQLAITDAAPAALRCEERGRIQVINSAVASRGDQAGKRWSERWTVAGCGRTADIEVDFRPDPQGRIVYEFRNQARR